MGGWVFKVPLAVSVLQHVKRQIIQLQGSYFHLVMQQGSSINHRVNSLCRHKIACREPAGIPQREIIHANGDCRQDGQSQAPDLRWFSGLLLNLRGHLRPVVIDIEEHGNDDC